MRDAHQRFISPPSVHIPTLFAAMKAESPKTLTHTPTRVAAMKKHKKDMKADPSKMLAMLKILDAALHGRQRPRPSLTNLEKLGAKFVKLVFEFARHCPCPKDKKADIAGSPYVVRLRVKDAIERERICRRMEREAVRAAKQREQ